MLYGLTPRQMYGSPALLMLWTAHLAAAAAVATAMQHQQLLLLLLLLLRC
jgi:hypothetical protein